VNQSSIAGGETTGTCLGAAVYYLLKTPRALDRLTAEIRGRWASYQDIDAASAQKLPYLAAVLQESLRIYPPGSLGFPRLSPGCEIDGLWVPRGTEVYTSAFTVTHDPDNFHDPETFVPERWIPGETVGQEKHHVAEASQPFSLGYRACIGRKYVFSLFTFCFLLLGFFPVFFFFFFFFVCILVKSCLATTWSHTDLRVKT
jgi:cytochrome P450